ncbi:MAG: DUF3618 domain-containing protein [Actinomycetota bacterium]|nr:DUF3618 domain-containing protein [Actinomycetota bacterium]MDQ3648390.1 DUF3618 domain-containing protein [Actinomycetota bacterium]
MTADENDATRLQGMAPPADPAQTDDPEQLRGQIGQTREDLGDTVEALSGKADVKAQASAKVGEIREKATNVAGEDVKHAAAAAKARAESNPLPAIAGALVAGFVIGRLTKRS